jgi:DNA-binding NarL/FixJ family response regulator
VFAGPSFSGMSQAEPSGMPGTGYWRIAVVEDHLLQRRATVALLDEQTGIRVVFECETFPELIRWLSDLPPSARPHLVVLDLLADRGPSVDPDAVRALVAEGIRIVVVSAMSSPPLLRRVLRAGATGVVGKRDPEEDLIAAVWTVLGRRRWMSLDVHLVLAGAGDRPRLSDQEERTLVLYATGLTLEEVAAALGVKRETAKTYLERVKKKYAALDRPARTKTDLVRHAVADGYIDLKSTRSRPNPT